MTPLWLSRVRLRRSASVATLAAMLLPGEDDSRVANGHRLIWSLFAHFGERAVRDFLWREHGNGVFYVLSAAPPASDHPLLEVDPPKPFEPRLEAGNRLRFSLRANPTIARPLDGFRTAHRNASAPPRRKTAHDDVVMRALHALPRDARAEGRRAIIESAGRAWLERQAAKHGFEIAPAPAPVDSLAVPATLRVDGYRVLRPPRARRVDAMRIGVLDFAGVLTVTDSARFTAGLKQGFGRAKAYGCGLMLIARM